MVEIEHFTPESIQEAILLLSKYTERAKIIAGGTDLLIQMRKEVTLPDFLINIGGICNLDYINHDETNGLMIGALTTISSIESSTLIQRKFSILAQAASKLGIPAIRNRATIGGNICNAAPSADSIPALIVLDAKVRIVGADGEKTVSIEDLFTGPGQTIIKPGQMLTEIQISELPSKSGGAYVKQTRRRGVDLAIAGVAVLVTMDGDILRDVKIALGAVAPTPIRAKSAEGILKGKRLDDRLLEKAVQAASHESSPIDDVRSSANYRRKLVTALVKRAVRQAVKQVHMEV